MPSSAPTVDTTPVRRLRSPISGIIKGRDVKAFLEAQEQKHENTAVVNVNSDRNLQAAAQSEFGLEVGLQGINGESSVESDGSSVSPAVVAVVVLVLLAAGCGLFFFCRAKKAKEEKQEIAVHHNSSNVNNSYSDQKSSSQRQQVGSSQRYN